MNFNDKPYEYLLERIKDLERELAAALAELANVNDDFDAAIEQRDKEIQKRKEISEAIVKLFKYLRPCLTDECQKLVDAADAAIQECGK